MRFYILTLLGLVVLVAGVFPFSGLSEQKRTIAVFYPSPYGEYKDLRTEFLAVGSDIMDAQNYPYNRIYNNGEICVQKRITFGGPSNPSPFSGSSGVPKISYDHINQELEISSSDNDLVFGSRNEISMLSDSVKIEPYKSIQIGRTPYYNTNGNLVMTQEIKIIGEETNITNKSINIFSPKGTVKIDFRGNDVQMNSSSPVSIHSPYYVSISTRNSSLRVGGGEVNLNGKLCLNGKCISQWSNSPNIKLVHNYCTADGVCTVKCPPGWIRISGGCRCATRDLEYCWYTRRSTDCQSTAIIEDRPTYPRENGWACYGRCADDHIYTYAVCLKTDLN